MTTPYLSCFWFIVWVSVRHSRMNGHYLVNAANKMAARRLIRSNTPHIVENVEPFEVYHAEMGEGTIEEHLAHLSKLPATTDWTVVTDSYYEVEFGT